MCGRAKLFVDYSQIKTQLNLSNLASPPNFKPSWNIAPTQDMLVVLRDSETGARLPQMMRWGVIPSFAKKEALAYNTFNARAESIDRTASFRGAWEAGRRCLVVTDGFYEWRKSDRQPFAVARSGKLTVMAGLWEVWRAPQGETVRSCTIVTVDASPRLAGIYHRMPVILPEADWPAWLGEEPADDKKLHALLKPYAADDLAVWPVASRVGNVRHDDAALAEPIPEADMGPAQKSLF